MTTIKRKLIEVSLPLEAINRESAREKSIRHGHPSTLHLWWARRPLAACRAVLFAQLVDDPSAHPEQFPTEEAQEIERQRLFDIIERLVVWENLNDKALLSEARAEILRAVDGDLPEIVDPFAGGGAIPLEAQRLGLRAQASDLNPVAVLINKALIEIPPTWSDMPPVFPGAAEQRLSWPRVSGLAEDVRLYGDWIQQEAERRIGLLYPKATLPDGTDAKVIAWIWARTVTCPNPACGVQMPLVRSWWLGKKKGKEAYVVPRVARDDRGRSIVEFSIGRDPKAAPTKAADGTVNRSGATCVACGTSVPLAHVRSEGRSGRIGSQLMAIAAEGNRTRHYLAPNEEHVVAARVNPPEDAPVTELPLAALGFRVQAYGMTQHSDLFTNRQLQAMTSFSDLVAEARDRVFRDALARGLAGDDGGFESGGSGALAYADSVAVYLAFVVDKLADLGNAMCPWEPVAECPRNLFARQAISMQWNFAEANPLSDSSGSWKVLMRNQVRDLEASLSSATSAGLVGHALQSDAATRTYENVIVSTDPPYYDNVGYAALSDFFYVWMRRTLGRTFPILFSTVLTPKADELVAEPFRHGDSDAAERFFESGFSRVFSRIREGSGVEYPITVFYAFKQSESEGTETASTGWQTLLEGMLRSGWVVTATWPVRTEMASRFRSRESNALASSIVLALRPRPVSAETVSRRGFVHALKVELPSKLKELQQGLIAPVDLAQATIGPGMAVFSRYARVLEADGSDMTVRTALALINQELDAVLSAQEGDFDAETRFAVKWFTQFGWNEAPSGEADILTRAVNTTVATLERGGIFRAAAGRSRLLEPSEMSEGWSPADDKAISVWEVAVRLGHALLTEGLEQATTWMREAASRVDLESVKELAYLMYSVCERKGWAESAMLFNALGTSWGDVAAATRSARSPLAQQGALDFDNGDD